MSAGHATLNIISNNSGGNSSNGSKVKLNIQAPRNAVKLNVTQPSPQRTPIKLNIQPSQTLPVKLNINTQTQPSPIKLNINKGKAENFRVVATDYQRYEDTREHIYNITDTYIGSDEQMPRSERVLNLETSVFQEEEITIPEGVERIFVEVSSNAGDNAARSLRNGIDPGTVKINMDRHTITVRNGGVPIPVEMHPTEQMWAPQLIFGMLHSSSNYDKSKVRTECGRNGYGAKLTNIFSKKFTVTVGDPHNQKHYYQEWRENMTQRDEPVIKEGYTGEPFVEVSYTMDFQRFGYEYYPDEAFKLYARHAADMSFSVKVPVSFNGKKLNVQKAKDYARLYLGAEAVKKSIVYYQWPKGTETVTKAGVERAVNKGAVPTIEICAVDTPDEALNVSFVNGMWTRNGGVHADAAFKAVATSLINTVNGSGSNKKKKKQSSSKQAKLNLGDVKRHVSMFVSCWLGDPKFDSQSKAMLKSPTPKITIDDKILQPIMKWDLVNRLYAELEAKQFRMSSKTDGKKRRYLTDLKGEDANDAGTTNSHNCTLYVTEGKSAMGFAEKMLSLYDNGRDFIGLMPLKGKPLNVTNASPEQIHENKEIIEIKRMLGLRDRVDYMLDENYETLRYGHLVVLADADIDGKHILGLVYNMFYQKYPTLLARGYVKYLRTKIIEVSKNKEVIKFYSTHEYEEWKENTPDYTKWAHRYFKGLGTSEDADIAEEFTSPKFVQSVFDELTPISLDLAFDKRFADARKKWIEDWQPDFKVETMTVQPISAFVNHELIQFSIEDIARSIPRFMDGLKVSQRKIIWGSMRKWKGSIWSKNKTPEKFKLAALSSYISSETSYHHGEDNLSGAIVNMVHEYTGANNLPYFFPHGQFGTRTHGGKDAGKPRYIFTKPQWWWKFIFKKEDNPLLDIIIDEGNECEPVTLLPVIPLHLINGALGIGTAHSTFIPNHDPLDICAWLSAKILGFVPNDILPWYRGFTGTIKLQNRGKRKSALKKDNTKESDSSSDNMSSEKSGETDETSEEYDESDEEEFDKDILVDKNTKYSMVTTGKFETHGKSKRSAKVIVTELPIGKATHDYAKGLTIMREKKLISGFSNYSKHDTVHFEITGMKNPSVRKLKLTKTFGMSNMVLLDTNNRPIKYKSTEEILESFYALRLPYYQKRKDNILKQMQEEINMLNNKILFIRAVVNGIDLIKSNPNSTVEEAVEKGCILSIGLSKKAISPQMEKLGFPAELLQKVALYQCTLEEMEAAQEKLDKLAADIEDLKNIPPEKLWLNDIDEFVAAYCKHYKCNFTQKVNVSKEALADIE